MSKPDILILGSEFYALQAMESIMKIEGYRHSHEKWLGDFRTYQNLLTHKLGQMIWDYTVLSLAGELRHAQAQSNYFNMSYIQGGKRNIAMVEARLSNPKHIIRDALYLFGPENVWAGGFGGKPWYDIAKAADQYGNLPTIAWVDHCMDLSHNNGSYFNKTDAGIFQYDGGNFKKLLDFKRVKSPEKVITGYLNSYGSLLVKLIKGSINIGAIRLDIDLETLTQTILCAIYDQQVLDCLHYEPIIWGNQPLDKIYVTTDNTFKAKSTKETQIKGRHKYAYSQQPYTVQQRTC